MVIISVEILFFLSFFFFFRMMTKVLDGWMFVVEVTLLRKGRKRLSFGLDKIRK